jgi:hypothetical protein
LKPASFAALPKTEKERMKVEAAYARTEEAIDGHPYLERERSLPGAPLALDRFAGRVRIDDRGNAVFPPFDTPLSLSRFRNGGQTAERPAAIARASSHSHLPVLWRRNFRFSVPDAMMGHS